jgi:hypothetical protein
MRSRLRYGWDIGSPLRGLVFEKEIMGAIVC